MNEVLPIREMSLYERMLANMEEHLTDDIESKVGIFWFDPVKCELFGVVKKDTSDKTLKTSHGLLTCSELHRDIWKKQYNKQKIYRKGIGPFVGDYKDTPRSRVFMDLETGDFEIRVGSWINQHKDAKRLIIDEFKLEGEVFRFKIDPH